LNILVTGFEPFGGSLINPSEQVTRNLVGQQINRSIVYTQILSVDRVLAPEQLTAALLTYQPDAVICLGEASGRAAISLERVALNLLDFRIPDNAGIQVADQPVIPGGPSAYMSTLPLSDIYTAIQKAGIPVELSLSAGSFLCNQVFYCLMHFLAIQKRNIPAGFIHLPALPEQAAQQSKVIPTMSLDTILRAVREAVQTIIQTTPSL
jgi:pyroglutamyl-peptidase